MAATLRSKSALIDESTGLYKDNTAGDISAQDLRDGIYSIYQPQGICGGRLTTESGVGVSTSDRTSQGTVYLTPHVHNLIGLHDGTSWTLHTFSEASLSVSTSTSGLPYDVFAYNNSGTVAIEKLAWTNGTTRATGLTTQDGVYVKSGDTTRLYVGTFYTTSTTTTEDSATKRFVWNNYNRVQRPFTRTESTVSWTYNTASFRQFNNSGSNQVECVVGIAHAHIELFFGCYGVLNTSGGVLASIGIGRDATNANIGARPEGSLFTANAYQNLTCHYNGYVPLGYHYYSMIELGAGSGTTTFYGNSRSGMLGSVEA
jgi:hypothetical protein